MSWVQLKGIVVRNWRDKMLALVLACLLWFMIKFQAGPRTTVPHQTDRPANSQRL